MDDLKKKFAGGVGDDALEDLKKSANGAGDALDDLKKGANDADDDLEKLKKTTQDTDSKFDKFKQNAKTLSERLTDLGKKGATAAFNGLKKVAGVSFKALLTGFTAVATGIGKITYDTVQAVGSFEQLKGGMEKIFDEADTSQIMKDANNAYLDLGLSANDYLSVINDVGATFASTMGDKAGYEAAKVGLHAISDYASGTGKSVDLLSEKFTLITRSTSSYQSIADQFSGILPATSKDFLKQAQSAGLLSTKYTELTKVPVAEYQQAVSKMLEKGVASLGLAGNTAAEAEGTITGSLGMVKATWSNLLVAMGSGENLDQCFANMIKASEAFGLQIIPVAEKALTNIGTLVEKLVPIISDKLPELTRKLLPSLLRAAASLTAGLLKALPDIVKVIVDELPFILREVGDAISEAFGIKDTGFAKFADFCSNNAGKIKKIIPVLAGLVGVLVLFSKVKSITSVFSGLFGGKSGGSGGKSGGMFSGFTDLAKLSPKTILKGMANLAIIFGGFTLLVAAFMLVAPYMAKLSDIKSIIEVVAVIGVLGFVGAGLAKLGKIAGEIPVSTVAKGLANMAIMIAGMSALFLLLGAVALIDVDLKKIVKISLIIGLLGTIGAALSVFAGIAGVIPVATVALGLANMAIMIAGMSALLLLIGAVSLMDFNYGRMFKLVLLIGLVGTIGAALSVFAGIVGMIPIPVVLAGLANMALVLGGITGLIIAFGKLSEVKGFNEFITKGGETLAKIFNVIGKIGGSLIGGIGEGITNSLPTIGKNLSAFAESLKPMFSLFEGVDMAGVGSFFSALGSFVLKLAGGKILEFFGGKPDFSGIAEGLGTLANSEGVTKFFTMVNGIEDTAFEKGKKFFTVLDGISNLPNVGGLGQLFSGENDFAGTATGLGKLAVAGVKNFFVMVNGIEDTAFDKAEKFFSSLDGISKLPNVGGLGQLFSGENDFEGVAKGLATLSGEGVKKFFTMVAGLKEETFTKTTQLFTALSDISKVGKKGFWESVGDFFGGNDDETSPLVNVADGLSKFAEKASSFFAQVNELKLGNLNGLWDSLKGAESLTDGIDKKVSKDIDSIVKKVSDLPKKMGNAFKQSGESLSSAFAEVWKEAVKASVAPVNKLLSGANHILKEFGSKKRVITWEPYANGTLGHKGGNALVNDGRGAELVQMPNGNTFIPNGRNVFIPNAPKGMKVLTAEQTAQLMGKKSPTFHYADGIGDIDIWSFYDNASGLVKEITEKISYKKMSGFSKAAGQGMVSTFSGEMTAWVDKLFEEEGGKSLASYIASQGVSQWRSTVIRALKMEGQYSAANVARTLMQMQTESGGNPRAINLWDSNAKRGIPSKGLMQVIDPTFQSYARKGFNKNIYDPLSNILASIRYAVSRYGSLARAFRGVGYYNGGVATSPSVFGEDGAEMAIPLSASKRKRGLDLWRQTGEILGAEYTPEADASYYSSSTTENNTYSPVFNLTVHGNADAKDLERKVKRWIAESMNETFAGLERRTRRVREV